MEPNALTGTEGGQPEPYYYYGIDSVLLAGLIVMLYDFNLLSSQPDSKGIEPARLEEVPVLFCHFLHFCNFPLCRASPPLSPCSPTAAATSRTTWWPICSVNMRHCLASKSSTSAPSPLTLSCPLLCVAWGERVSAQTLVLPLVAPHLSSARSKVCQGRRAAVVEAATARNHRH